MTLEFAGENPCVVLYDADGMVVSAISYWNANFSLAGPGRALFFVTKQNGRVEGRIFAERHAPVDFFRSLNQHFLGFEAVVWATVQPEIARFEADWTGNAYELQCSHANGRVEVAWSGIEKPWMMNQRSIDFGREIGRSYDIASVIIAARDGAISVDGGTLPGSVTAPYGALPRSAFLAFCETWTRL